MLAIDRHWNRAFVAEDSLRYLDANPTFGSKIEFSELPPE